MSRPMPVVIKSVAYGTLLVPGADQKMGLFNAATTSEVERFRLSQKGSLSHHEWTQHVGRNM